MNMSSALISPCDVYFYSMAERVGIDKISAYAKECGFGEPSGIDLPYERVALFLPRNGSAIKPETKAPGRAGKR